MDRPGREAGGGPVLAWTRLVEPRPGCAGEVQGDVAKLYEQLQLLDHFEASFPLVEPVAR